MPGNEALAASLGQAHGWAVGAMETRHFPDGESYVRIVTAIEARPVILVCTLAHPDEKFLPLIFAAATARELGAQRVGLVAPVPCLHATGPALQSRRGRDIEGMLRSSSPVHSTGWSPSIRICIATPRSARSIQFRSRVLHAAPLMSEWINDECRKPAHHRARQRERAMGLGGSQGCGGALLGTRENTTRRPRRCRLP